MEYKILTTRPSEGYELIDSGNGEKMERYGNVVISRPDPQALWKKSLNGNDWKNVYAFFSREEIVGGKASKGKWINKKETPESWNISISDMTFKIKLSPFKHTGIFPEQAPNWEWMKETIEKSGRKPKVLNLFGYTGGATLACAKAGAEVVHLDGSKSAIAWAKENAELSGLKEKPIRFILDDAQVFIKREITRGNKYDAIIMDPPAFGHGPDGEVWKIEEDFPKLIDACKKILSDDPLFVLINGYASGYSPIAYKNNIDELVGKRNGEIEIGELTIEESSGRPACAGRLLPAGIFARWRKI